MAMPAALQSSNRRQRHCSKLQGTLPSVRPCFSSRPRSKHCRKRPRRRAKLSSRRRSRRRIHLSRLPLRCATLSMPPLMQRSVTLLRFDLRILPPPSLLTVRLFRGASSICCGATSCSVRSTQGFPQSRLWSCRRTTTCKSTAKSSYFRRRTTL